MTLRRLQCCCGGVWKLTPCVDGLGYQCPIICGQTNGPKYYTATVSGAVPKSGCVEITEVPLGGGVSVRAIKWLTSPDINGVYVLKNDSFSPDGCLFFQQRHEIELVFENHQDEACDPLGLIGTRTSYQSFAFLSVSSSLPGPTTKLQFYIGSGAATTNFNTGVVEPTCESIVFPLVLSAEEDDFTGTTGGIVTIRPGEEGGRCPGGNPVYVTNPQFSLYENTSVGIDENGGQGTRAVVCWFVSRATPAEIAADPTIITLTDGQMATVQGHGTECATCCGSV